MSEKAEGSRVGQLIKNLRWGITAHTPVDLSSDVPAQIQEMNEVSGKQVGRMLKGLESSHPKPPQSFVEQGRRSLVESMKENPKSKS